MPRTRIESETLTLIDGRPLALAHRGARLQAPENTVSAFQLVLDHGCDGFECDVRATADGQIVICHDADYMGLEVADSNYAELALAAEACSCEKPARLDELISRFGERAYMDLELKLPGMAARLTELLKDTRRESVLVSSFLSEALEEMRSADASLQLAGICDDGRELERWQRAQVQAMVLHLRLVSPEVVHRFQTGGKQVMVWAAERAHEIELLMEMGVDGIISGHTRILADKVTRPKARAAALGR